MMIFWWMGKGYLTPLILFSVLIIFGVILQFGRPVLPDAPWFWRIAFMIAGGINWTVGRRKNARKAAKEQPTRLLDQLLYRARHKFMSLPLETWSIPLFLGGLAAILYSLTR